MPHNNYLKTTLFTFYIYYYYFNSITNNRKSLSVKLLDLIRIFIYIQYWRHNIPQFIELFISLYKPLTSLSKKKHLSPHFPKLRKSSQFPTPPYTRPRFLAFSRLQTPASIARETHNRLCTHPPKSLTRRPSLSLTNATLNVRTNARKVPLSAGKARRLQYCICAVSLCVCVAQQFNLRGNNNVARERCESRRQPFARLFMRVLYTTRWPVCSPRAAPLVYNIFRSLPLSLSLSLIVTVAAL